MTRRNWYGEGMAHYQVALALFQAGEPHQDELRAANLCALEAMRVRGVRSVEIHRHDDACEACRAVPSEVLDIADAMAQAPLPVQVCTHVRDERPSFCRCEYVPHEEPQRP